MTKESLYTPYKIRTYGGVYVNVMQMKSCDVFAEDIAKGLARECRFANHTKRFYSVADHSVWCMKKAMELYPDDKTLHLQLLLHDAHEAYIGDLSTPMVDAIDQHSPGFKAAIETTKRLVQGPINERFGLALHNPLESARVKEIDRLALEWEWKNKVLGWTGFAEYDEFVSAEIFIDYLKHLVKVPIVIAA